MKKILLSVIVIYSLLLLTACPQETVVRRAAKASYELSGLTVDVINAVGKAYANNLIDIRTKDDLANKLKTLSVGGMKFNQLLESALKDANGDETKVTPDKIQNLNKVFSDDVVMPFLEILQLAKVISPANVNYLHSAIAALRTAILTISLGFSSVRAGIKFTGEVNIYA